MRKILSIDGGGIRGMIPAVVLRRLESEIGPVSDSFNLIAGTSTGGILALGLTAPDGNGDRPRYFADDMVRFYRSEGPGIFRRGWRPIASLGGLTDERYPSRGIEDALRRAFSDARLSECMTETLVTAWDLEAHKPYFFKRWRAVTDDRRDCLVRHVARATSAAPTYFEPARIPMNGGEIYLSGLVDGGMIANNPAMCAVSEARRLWPGEECIVVSLGTGRISPHYTYERAKGWGVAGWARPLMDILLNGGGELVDYQLARDPGIKYHRLQIELTEANHAMDDASAKNLYALEREGERLAESPAFSEVIEALK